MEIIGCRLDGYLNDSNFTEPMPWIGVYVAVACMACAILTGFDVHDAWFQWKTWWPCKFFSLNATSFTLIGISIKFSADINTPMPGSEDQLVKLSGAVLMCTTMGNTLPSLGTMENKEILVNLSALAILVGTLLVDILLQLKTGAIYRFRIEHVIVMCLMLLLLIIMTSVGISVPAIKRCLEMKYIIEQRSPTIRDADETTEKSVVKKLRKDLERKWLVAHTTCPQFVIAKSGLSSASAMVSLLGVITLVEAITRAYAFFPKVCRGDSSYKWTTLLVFFAQTIAVGVGSIAPFFRWFTCFASEVEALKQSLLRAISVEDYWVERLKELRDCSLPVRIHNRSARKLAHDVKRWTFELVILLQQTIVVGCGLTTWFTYLACFAFLWLVICLFSALSLPCLCIFGVFTGFSNLKYKVQNSANLLYDDLVPLRDVLTRETASYFITGQKKQPKYLIELMQKTFSEVYIVRSFNLEKPPCWALTVATVTTIAVAIPHIDSNLLKELLAAVSEGLKYAKLIEEKLDATGDMTNLRKAADMVWVKADLYHKWLHESLDDLGAQDISVLIEKLHQIAHKKFNDTMATAKISSDFLVWDENSSKWPIEALAAYSIEKLTEGLKQEVLGPGERLFDRLTFLISETFYACFRNLERVITIESHHGTRKGREERVGGTIFLLAQTEEILKILEHRNISSEDQLASISEPPSLGSQQEATFLSTTSSTSSDDGLTNQLPYISEPPSLGSQQEDTLPSNSTFSSSDDGTTNQLPSSSEPPSLGSQQEDTLPSASTSSSSSDDVITVVVEPGSPAVHC